MLKGIETYIESEALIAKNNFNHNQIKLQSRKQPNRCKKNAICL